MLDFGFYCMDCLDGMKQFPDKYFDLAICDPPYGIKRLKNPKGRLEKYGDTTKANNDVPTDDYFKELFRVSQNIIIWGGNYFNLPPCRCFIVWYKQNPVENYSDVEYAWTNFERPSRIVNLPYYGNIGADEVRIHPTQKPVALYKRVLEKYSKDGDTILDTHVGSGSSLVACRETGHKYVGFEIDPVYYELAKKRLDAAENQMNIFDFME